MAPLQPTLDPYRVLGVLRGASIEQIKVAYRRLAKRYHPDSASGDQARFLALQDAYKLLTDPLRRREWDRLHAPGPMRSAGDRGRAQGSAADIAGARPGRGAAKVRRPRPMPGARKHTWSAEHVPWWEDFRPGTRDPATRTPRPAAEPPAGPDGDTADEASNEFDVFSRSSGAAWSSAARRHFRRGTDDLPSRGVWRYRGTQVVTGAEARKVAAEEEERSTR